MKTPLWLAGIAGACFALGFALKANLWEVAIGLLVGGGVGGLSMYVLRKLQSATADNGAEGADPNPPPAD